MATEAVVTPTKPADAGLKRDVGLIGAIWSSEGSIIGSGWLFGALLAAQAAGTAAIISWVIATFAVILLALVHSELGAMYPVAGGTARFPHYAFGSVAGISFGFFSWLQAVVVAPVECFAVLQYGSYYWHGVFNPKTSFVTGTGFAMTVVLMAIFTLVNFMAIRWVAHTNSGLTWWKVAVPVLAIIVLFTKFHGGNFGAGGGFAPYGVKGVLGAIATAGVMFALLGFEQADQLAGEIRNPQKNLPRAIVGSILIGATIYLLLQIVFIGALPPSQLTHGFANISNANIIAGPFAGLAGLVGLGWLAIVLRLDAFISPFGTGLIYVTSTSRVGYGLARNRYYPQIFAKTDRRGVPWFALLTAFVLGLVFLLPFPSWHSLIKLVTSASVLMYAGAPLALGAFRRQVPDASRPYRMGGAAVLSPLAFVIASLIVYWSGWDTIWKLGVCIVIGYVIIGISMAFDSQRPVLNWRAASWLPVYLVGMGLISWQGSYCSGGPASSTKCGAQNHITFLSPWGDLIIVAIFAVIIYYWAQATRLPREKMLQVVGQQAAYTEPAAGS
jgi:amino acid transporter